MNLPAASPEPTIAQFTGDADFFARAEARLSLDIPHGDTHSPVLPHGDHSHDAGSAGPRSAQALRPAAVLIGVVGRAEAGIIMTRRAAHLRDHSGQVALPGGKIDAADASPLAAALREAQEEISLDPALVSPIGYLEPYLTGTGFRVIPVLARVSPLFEPVIDQREVDAVFEAPLAFLMSPQNHRREAREWGGVLRHYYSMPWQDHHIWGATAGMIRALRERLYGSSN